MSHVSTTIHGVIRIEVSRNDPAPNNPSGFRLISIYHADAYGVEERLEIRCFGPEPILVEVPPVKGELDA